MTAPLWTWDELAAAAEGVADGAPSGPITGFAIDSRQIVPGDVFVALTDQRDGHEFVPSAFAAGAVAAVVAEGYTRQSGAGALVRVKETLKGLEAIGKAARARLSPEARVVAVTGSAGKTGSKEMLRGCLTKLGATHAPEKSFNNHWGVPLTLARMPAATDFGVFEIGMNHAGEITPLTRLVRPHVAVITTVEPVHLGYFASVEEIADAKAEIFLGLEPNGVAVLNRDNPHFDRLKAKALAAGAYVASFGTSAQADVRPGSIELGSDGTKIQADCFGGRVIYSIGAPGRHLAMNSLAVLAAIEALEIDFESTIYAMSALADFRAPAGRGAREQHEGPRGRVLLVDESYNANPASMRAALASLALVPRADWRRRVVVMGDMLELGERSQELHAELAEAVEAAGADIVFASGPHMKAMFDRLGLGRRGAWAQSPDGLERPLLDTIGDGDMVMVKGSLGSRMGPLVTALRSHIRGASA
ncbi:MAG: UDP-N-acetylmuramoylalanyl-D-glutamyl-2,6-diaminopimelate--D-alanyl-D-alanine ligase [Hyphomicrobiaceae bacterium]